MVRTTSTMMPLGTVAPEFALPRCEDGATVSIADFSNAKALLVIFMCNHCPYVIHVAPQLKRLADEYMEKEVAVVGISSNDADAYPDDAPEKMAEEKAMRGYPFPYLYDENQQVAKAYGAACTPDFFLFDEDRKLYYRGQLDDSRPDSGTTPDGTDLRAALDALLNGKPAPETQKPSLGCNIKWKPGDEPEYFNPPGTA